MRFPLPLSCLFSAPQSPQTFALSVISHWGSSMTCRGQRLRDIQIHHPDHTGRRLLSATGEQITNNLWKCLLPLLSFKPSSSLVFAEVLTVFFLWGKGECFVCLQCKNYRLGQRSAFCLDSRIHSTVQHFSFVPFSNLICLVTHSYWSPACNV